MAGGKLTPRQKMINMMYLVLTALLALNVSNEVLNAFKLVNDGLTTSNTSLVDKNNIIYTQFAQQADVQDKAKPLYDKALQAKKISKDIYDQIEDYKKQIIKEAGGINSETGDINQRDNIDIASRIFVEHEGKNGKDLYGKLVRARKQFQAVLGGNRNIPLNPDDVLKGKPNDVVSKGWEFATFNHVPATAAVTILSKFQNDVISTEGTVIEDLFKQINARDYKFDQLTAAVIAPSSYLMQGGKYTAQIFVAASSKDQNPEVFIGSLPAGAKKNPSGSYDPIESASGDVPGTLLKVEDGKGIYESDASVVGEKKYFGAIRVQNPDGSGYKLYPFEGTYQVGAKSITVSAEKMNVLYIGVDNPMLISAAGVQNEDIVPSISAGTLSKGADGKWNALVTTVGKTTINVGAKIGGKVEQMGTAEFRVKRLPDPIASVGGIYTGGNIAAANLKAQSGLVAKMPAGFDFEAKFSVVSYKMYYTSKGEAFGADTQGPGFSTQMQGFLGRAKSKDVIFIDEIKVVGPDKQTRKLQPIAFNITG